MRQRGFGLIEVLVVFFFFSVLIAGVWYVVLREPPVILSSDFIQEQKIFTDPGIVNVEVLRIDDQTYRMFYHNKGSISSAVSNDGKEFTLEDAEVILGQMPATIQFADHHWRMYFVEGKDLRSATSTDGRHFEVESGIRLSAGVPGSPDVNGIIHPSIISLPNNQYRLYYDGVGESSHENEFAWSILSARSLDGLTWEKDPGVRLEAHSDDDTTTDHGRLVRGLDFDLIFSPHATYKDGSYTLYFSGQTEPLSYSGIYRATSSDGLAFTVDPHPLVIRDSQYGDTPSNSPGGPQGMPQDPFVYAGDTVDRLFYWKVGEGLFSAVKTN